MADILYTYKNQVYANITNQCNCRCTFCIRSHEDGVGDAEHPGTKKIRHWKRLKLQWMLLILPVMMSFVYCGYMENRPVRFDILLASAKYAKEKYGVKIRINTNGLGNLQHGREYRSGTCPGCRCTFHQSECTRCRKIQCCHKTSFRRSF